MKIELRKLKIYERASEETTAFNADLYVDGRLIGFASNKGHGDPIHIDANSKIDNAWDLIKLTEEYCQTLPNEPCEYFEDGLPMDLELYLTLIVDKAVNEQYKKKDALKLKKNMEKGICVGTVEEYSIIEWKKHTISSLLSIPQGVAVLKAKIAELKAKGETILNDNLPDNVLN